MTVWCDACGGTTVSNGGKRVSYRDLSPDGPVHVSAMLRRRLCRNCGSVMYGGRPELKKGFRMTPELYRWIAESCCRETFSSVAGRCSVDEKTVRSVWRSWIREMSIDVGHPQRALLTAASVGRHNVSVVRSLPSGAFLTAFPGTGSPSLLGWLRTHEHGVLYVDVAHAELVSSVAPPGLRVVCDRHSVAEWFESVIWDVMKSVRKWLDREGKRELSKVWDAVSRPHSWRSPEDDAMLDGLESANVRRLWKAIDGFRAVWRTSSLDRAQVRYEKWLNELPMAIANDFKRVVGKIQRIFTLVFNELYGVIAGTFPAVKAACSADMSGVSKEQAAGMLCIAAEGNGRGERTFSDRMEPARRPGLFDASDSVGVASAALPVPRF